MQKWEYHVDSIMFDRANKARVESLDYWGQRGWELVSETLYEGEWHWTFKRPKGPE